MLGGDLRRAERQGEDQHHQRHAAQLAEDAHRGHDPVGAAVGLSAGRADDRVDIGRGKQAEAEAGQGQRKDQISQARFDPEIGQQHQPGRADGCPQAGDIARLEAIRQAPGQGRDQRHHERLAEHHEAREGGRQAL